MTRTVRCRYLIAAALATLTTASALTAPLMGPIGTSQRVALVVCQYEGSDDVPFTSTELAERANDVINEYYLGATGGRVSMNFIAVPGICQFNYTYEETDPADTIREFLGVDADDSNVVNDVLEGFRDLFETGYDPFVLFREGQDVVAFAESQIPGIFNNTGRVLFVLNRSKRAMSTRGQYPIYQTSWGRFTPLSLAMIDSSDAGDESLSTAAHELGHQLGLPDLYREGPDEERFVEFWGEMASNRQQNFMGWSRNQQGWVASNRVVTLTPDPNANITQQFRIGPPNSGAGDIEILRLNAASVLAGTIPDMDLSALPPFVADMIGFAGFVVEARPRRGLDTNLPDDYEPGVLISWIDPIGNAMVPTIRPVFVRAHQTTPSTNADGSRDGNWLTRAAYSVGEAFVDEDTGIAITVDQEFPDGSYLVTLDWESPPRPNVVARDTWLDSPENGFGNLDEPNTFGDMATVNVVIEWQDNSPFPSTPILPPEISVPIHRQVFEVSNTGDLTAQDVRAHIMVLRPQLPMGFDLGDPASFLPFAITDREVDLGNLDPGEVTTVFLEHRPEGPFVAAMFLEPAHNEAPLDLANNARIEPFIIPEVTFGSPYNPVDLDLDVTNFNRYPNIVVVTPSIAGGIPDGWTVDMNQTFAAVGSRRSASFHFHAQPPDPDDAKPGEIQTLNLTGWMNYGDSFVPIMTWPIHVALNHPTRLTLIAEGVDKPARGMLSYLVPEGDWEPLPDSQITVTVTGSDGTAQTLNTVTDERGEYLVMVEGDESVSYAVVSHYARRVGFTSSTSEPAIIGAGAETESAPTQEEEVSERPSPGPVISVPGRMLPEVQSLEIQTVRTRQGPALRGTVTISRAAPRGGFEVILNARPAEAVIIPRTATVPAGEAAVSFDIAASRVLQRSMRVTITATGGGAREMTSVTVGPDALTPPQEPPPAPIRLPVEEIRIDGRPPLTPSEPSPAPDPERTTRIPQIDVNPSRVVPAPTEEEQPTTRTPIRR